MNKIGKRSTRKASRQRRSNWRGLRKIAPVVSTVHGKTASIIYVDEHGNTTELGTDKVIVNLPSESRIEFILKDLSKMVAFEPNDVRSVARKGPMAFVVKTYTGEKIYFSVSNDAEKEKEEEAEASKQEKE